MEELLASLEVFEDEELLRIACGWIEGNEALWRQWQMPRQVPFYADTLNAIYPFPMLFSLLFVAIMWMLCLENWLKTTLSCSEWRRVLKENNQVWRSDVELKLRKSLDSPRNSPRRNPSGLHYVHRH